MKAKSFILSFIIIVLAVSCKHVPAPPYEYETKPNYTYMGVSYYGQYYRFMDIDGYVFSLTFYSEGMVNEDSTLVEPPGQELYIEDFFVPEENLLNLTPAEGDTVLTEAQMLALLKGTYSASGKASSETFGDTFTFAPGEYQQIDSITYILGARITYYEEDDFYSKRLLITGGTFTVDEAGIRFDFQTEDGQKLYGSYESAFDGKMKMNLKSNATKELQRAGDYKMKFSFPSYMGSTSKFTRSDLNFGSAGN